MSTVISYLIPSYNHEKYLLNLLESIKEDIGSLDVAAEVIIIDDGSTDDSPIIIKNWAEDNAKHFKILYAFQENRGIAAALNTLIEKSSGRYIRVCASDDVIICGSTQLLLNEFNYQAELLCVLANGKVIDDKGAIIHESSIAYHGASPERLLDKKSLVKELIQHWCVAGPSILVKRSHYDTMRYDEASKIEDIDLFLSLLKIPNSVTFINDPVCLYRIHETNTSKTKNTLRRIENLKSFLMIIDKYLHNDALCTYLLPLKYKSKAKVNYLQKNYIKCMVNLSISLLFNVKNSMRIQSK